MDVAGAIVKAATGCGSVEVDGSASSGSYPAKRRQPDSVVTLLAQPPRNRGCDAGQPAAGWMRGKAANGAYATRGNDGRTRRGLSGGGRFFAWNRRVGSWHPRASGWRWYGCRG